jgi:hypothetical protein
MAQNELGPVIIKVTRKELGPMFIKMTERTGSGVFKNDTK